MADRRSRGPSADLRRAAGRRAAEGARQAALRRPGGDFALAREAYVGRADLVAILRAGLDRAVRRQGAAYLLIGEAGIGKTRTTLELAALARRTGFDVRIGRCVEDGPAPPYWPWLEIFRSHAADRDPATLEAELGVERPLLAPLLPGFPTTPVAADRDDPDLGRSGRDERLRLFEAARGFLARAAETRPLLLVVDDLHEADLVSVQLLRHVARALEGIRLMVVGTYRDAAIRTDDPRGREVAALARHAEPLRLGPLAVTEVARLVEITTGVEVAPAVVDALAQRCDGNPFFVRELARLFATTGRLDGPLDGAVSLPETVRAVLEQRLTPLGDEARQLLVIAALAGRDFDARVLAHAGCLEVARARSLLDDAVAAHLVERTDPPDGHRFVHALVRDALADQPPSHERMTVHARIARALVAVHGADLDPHRERLTRQLLLAGDPAALAEAATHAERLAEIALTRLAHENAADWYATAIRALTESVLPTTDVAPRLLELRLALGHARTRAGDRPGARRTFLEAADAARELGDASGFARAALGFCGRADPATEPDRDMERLLEEALATLAPEPSGLRARLLARLAMALAHPGGPARRLALGAEAVAVAEACEDVGALALALGARHAGLQDPDHVEERLTVATRIVELARRTGSAERELGGRYWRLLDRLEMADGAGAARDLREYERLAGGLGQPFYAWQATALRATFAIFEGRFAEGRRLADAAVALGRRTHSPNAALLAFIHDFTIRAATGGLGELEGPLRDLAENFPTIPAFRAGLALVQAETDRLDEARSSFERFAASDFTELPRDTGWLNGMDELAQVCARLGDAPRAHTLGAMLAPYAERIVVVPYGGAVNGPVARYLGLLAATAGDLDAAARHFAAAIERARRLGARPAAAHAARDWAAMLLARDGMGDRERARALLAEAAVEFQTCGMTPHLERADALAERAAVPGGRPAQPPRRGRLVRERREWVFEWDGETIRVPDSRGLRFLGELVQRPDEDVHVLDLCALVDGAPREGGTGEAALDARARAELRTRLAELREALATADELADVGRAAACRAEIDTIEESLQAAFGLGGRARRTGDRVERARKAVYNRIRGALAAVERASPALGRHLGRSIATGTCCAYRPERPTTWVVVSA